MYYPKVMEIVKKNPLKKKSDLAILVAKECRVHRRTAFQWLTKAEEYGFIQQIEVKRKKKQRGKLPQIYICRQRGSWLRDKDG